MTTKNDIISSIYYEPAGYGSIYQTFKDVKQKQKDITLDDVKKW